MNRKSEKIYIKHFAPMDLKFVSDKKLDESSGHDKNENLTGLFREHYKKRNSQNRKLKGWFFWLTFALLFIVVGFMGTSVIYLILNWKSVESIIGIIGAFATALTSILVLPKMIGHYLFQEKEDTEILQYLQELKNAELKQKILEGMNTKTEVPEIQDELDLEDKTIS